MLIIIKNIIGLLGLLIVFNWFNEIIQVDLLSYILNTANQLGIFNYSNAIFIAVLIYGLIHLIGEISLVFIDEDGFSFSQIPPILLTRILNIIFIYFIYYNFNSSFLEIDFAPLIIFAIFYSFYLPNALLFTTGIFLLGIINGDSSLPLIFPIFLLVFYSLQDLTNGHFNTIIPFILVFVVYLFGESISTYVNSFFNSNIPYDVFITIALFVFVVIKYFFDVIIAYTEESILDSI
jgi:hypothetical protein